MEFPENEKNLHGFQRSPYVIWTFYNWVGRTSIESKNGSIMILFWYADIWHEIHIFQGVLICAWWVISKSAHINWYATGYMSSLMPSELSHMFYMKIWIPPQKILLFDGDTLIRHITPIIGQKCYQISLVVVLGKLWHKFLNPCDFSGFQECCCWCTHQAHNPNYWAKLLPN